MKKKEMVPLTDKENKSYEKQKVSYIRKQKFSTGENDKVHLNYTMNSNIIVNTMENLEELLIVFAI